MKFPVQPGGAVIAQCLLAQAGRGDPRSNSCPAVLPALEWGESFANIYWNGKVFATFFYLEYHRRTPHLTDGVLTGYSKGKQTENEE